MIGLVLAAVVGAVLGWLAGHVALIVPAGVWNSWTEVAVRLRSERTVEHVLGAAFGAVALPVALARSGSSADFAVTAVFLLLLTVTLIIDLRHHLVYPLMPLAGFASALLLNPLAGEVGLLSSLVGGLAGGGAFLAIFLLGLLIFRTQALGFGDVLLALMIGAMVGFGATPRALFLGMLFGATASLGLLAFRRKALRDYIPVGSGMCLAAMLVLIERG